ncbi:SpoIIE family protein phosphatase [Guptibacillus hwajinpoensis]|uniref:Phosphoserine phosphatase n=1 Tax=Guptibacillus hwajinpoensis TaxID=208199 RepID=A0A0J6FVJ4_9BACL|nr:SpoIIE family protein phosphatase [Alkalihalobacillus macyae]KMM38387.1 phosphoserine phosphatase [Alkalihalobacillus macyae]
MENLLNHAPCGFLTLSEDGTILAINQTLLTVLEYDTDVLIGKNINHILTVPARIFYQLYFIPLIKADKPVEEMYISLQTANGEDIPVLINAIQRKNSLVIDCVLVQMHKRNEYENELLIAKKKAETALSEKRQANKELEVALHKLEMKQKELIELNKENQKFKLETQMELHLAKNIQETSLTKPIFTEGLQIEAFYQASSELSGDMYGFYHINPNQYGIIILDVMGHGISSALITMSLQSLFQRLILNGFRADIIFKELDNHLYRLFQENDETWHYCTAIYLFIDTDQRTIEYINAGHPPGLWQNSTGEQLELTSTSPPIGSFPGLTFKRRSLTYNKGGRILLYTDGVVDPYDSHLLTSLLENNQGITLTELKQKLVQLMKDEENGYHNNDDQCFILIDLKGVEEQNFCVK